MTAADIAAFVGAAAWLPQIGRWLYMLLAHPRLTLLTAAKAEVGYTSFGPIFNIRLSLSCQRRDVVINRMEVDLIHESSERRHFRWQGTRETFSHMKDASGRAVGSFERDSEALAVKVTTQSVYDSLFRFQEVSFISQNETLLNAVVEHEAYLRASGADHRRGLLNSEPMHKLNALHRDAFWWKPGIYRVEFRISALTKVSVVGTKKVFALTSADVEGLRKNIANIPESYEVIVMTGTEGYDKSEPTWHWRNPAIRGG